MAQIINIEDSEFFRRVFDRGERQGAKQGAIKVCLEFITQFCELELIEIDGPTAAKLAAAEVDFLKYVYSSLMRTKDITASTGAAEQAFAAMRTL